MTIGDVFYVSCFIQVYPDFKMSLPGISNNENLRRIALHPRLPKLTELQQINMRITILLQEFPLGISSIVVQQKDIGLEPADSSILPAQTFWYSSFVDFYVPNRLQDQGSDIRVDPICPDSSGQHGI